MTTLKKLGIWMDHASANIMEFTIEPIETKKIESKFTHQSKEESLHKSEKTMHNKEQHLQSEYYKKLGEVILNYNRVIIFGPTDAKTELFNLIKTDHRFSQIKIVTEHADKMSENQQHAYVREYFSKQLI